MEGANPSRRASILGRHPVTVFILGLAPLSALMHLLWANIAGGWAVWGTDILWYRLSCIVNDLALAGGAYAIARYIAGPLWFQHRRTPGWYVFPLVCAAGAVFLLILTRRLVTLYGDLSPPMATGWLAVWQRTWLPLLFLLWVRKRWLSLPWPTRRRATGH